MKRSIEQRTLRIPVEEISKKREEREERIGACDKLARLVCPTYYYNRSFPFIKLSVAIVAFEMKSCENHENELEGIGESLERRS